MRGKYILLFMLSLVQMNIFYFSLVAIIDFKNYKNPTAFQTTNFIFSVIGIFIIGISFILTLAYNIYVNYYTLDK